MSLKVQDYGQVPADTAAVAHAVFPKGHPYLLLRDELGDLYADERFRVLFSSGRGRPAESPGRLALVTVLQWVENIDDRVAADQVRARIDWKYLLGLSLTDPGFHYSVLADFRRRLLEGGLEAELLEALLERLKARGVLRKGDLQRTDATHVLAAVRELNRLECVGETLRYALNSLAVVAPEWLRERVPQDWFERYAQRFENTRLPANEGERTGLAETIGYDGLLVLRWCYADAAPSWLREVPAVETLRRVWIQQYYWTGTGSAAVLLRWRTPAELPPHAIAIVSPYDVEAHYATKRSTHWTGYKVHLTETCEPNQIHLITNVETTPSTVPDVVMTDIVHRHLAEQDLLPDTHLVDAGYTDADALVTAASQLDVELLGPVAEDSSWQARAGQGFGVGAFEIDWEAHIVTCPRAQISSCWSESENRSGRPIIHVRFPPAACRGCEVRENCTRGTARTLSFHPREQHEALHARREEQHSAAFKKRYKRRAGIEGTLSQGVRCCGLRRARYIGLTKNHLQHLATAAAINLMRSVDWFSGSTPGTTRCSRFAALCAT